jgi:hypothetical protein
MTVECPSAVAVGPAQNRRNRPASNPPADYSEMMKPTHLSQITVEWLDRVARPGETPDDTIVRLLRERDRTPPRPDDLLARRDAALRLDEL